MVSGAQEYEFTLDHIIDDNNVDKNVLFFNTDISESKFEMISISMDDEIENRVEYFGFCLNYLGRNMGCDGGMEDNSYEEYILGKKGDYYLNYRFYIAYDENDSLVGETIAISFIYNLEPVNKLPLIILILIPPGLTVFFYYRAKKKVNQ